MARWMWRKLIRSFAPLRMTRLRASLLGSLRRALLGGLTLRLRAHRRIVSSDSGDGLADDEIVDVVRPFIGLDGFEVQHVTDDGILVRDSIGAEDVAGHAGGLQRDVHVV